MKRGAKIVNTARGGLIDTDALVEAVTSGHLSGAALDVFEREPLAIDSPLIALPSVVLTPHISWYSEESYGELKDRTIRNVVDVLVGAVPRNIINPEGFR
jgi:D-3-phosphoglycerate dehydrogenase